MIIEKHIIFAASKQTINLKINYKKTCLNLHYLQQSY